MLQAYTLLLTISIALFSCDLASTVDKNNAGRKDNKGNKDKHVVANLEFSDTNAVTKEVGELFSLIVKVSNINLKNLDDSVDIGNNPSADKLRVELDVVKDGKAYGNLYGNKSIANGEAKFERLTFDKECAEGCQLVARLQYYMGDSAVECMPPDYSRCYVDLKPVNVASKDAVFTASSYEVQAKHRNGKEIEISVTKSGAPLAGGKISVYASVPCVGLNVLPPTCVYPRDNDRILSVEAETLGSDGHWSTVLDDGDSWKDKSNEGTDKEPYDLVKNICKVNFSVMVDGRYFSNIQLTGGSC